MKKLSLILVFLATFQERVYAERLYHEPMILDKKDLYFPEFDELFAEQERKEEAEKEKKAPTIVFSADKSVSVENTNDFYKAVKLKEFDRDVTSLVIYENYLFVSLARSDEWFSEDSQIWRANITYPKNFTIAVKSWERIGVANNLFDDITCMVGVKGKIYAGLSDGSILKCSAEEKDKCEYLHTLPKSINGIDYDPNSGRIYASTKKSVHNCSLDIKDSCSEVALPEFLGITSLKVNFDAIWLGVKKEWYFFDQGYLPWVQGTWLYKHSIRSDKSTGYGDKYYGKLPDSLLSINTISASSRYVYFGLDNGLEVWRCEPEDVKCSRILSTSLKTDTVIVANK